MSQHVAELERSQPPRSNSLYWTVPKLWPGSTVVCIGGGPSLDVRDIEACVRAQTRIIAVNNAYRLCPHADLLYGCDAQWWGWHGGVPDFDGIKVTLDARAKDAFSFLKLLRNDSEGNRDKGGLCLEPDGVRTGRNGGYQAVNLAAHLGAKRILLLGYDMQPGPRGEMHWHEEHPRETRTSMGEVWRRHFPSLVGSLGELGIEVVNCTRVTALDCFPKMMIEDALAHGL